METVPIPDFFIALVIPGASRAPNDEEVEHLREQTVAFWTQQLKEMYSDDNKHQIETLALSVKKIIFGERLGADNKKDLEEKFNIYIELSGQALFSSKRAPNGNQVFGKMVAGDSMDYLCDFVKNMDNDSPFVHSIEVCARRVQDDPDNEIFVVKSPTFFVALATDPFDDEEDRAPNEKEIKEFLTGTKERIVAHLEEAYPDTFMDLDLTLSKAQFDSKLPDDRFKMYFEMDATATFFANPPSPDELFAIIMKCASTDSTKYMTRLREIEGSPFVAATMVTIQIVGMEMPEAEALEELPPPEEEAQESGDEGEPEEGDGEAIPPKQQTISRQVPVFLALVVNAEPPAELPTKEELDEFENMVLRYFYTLLKQDYPDSLVDMKLKEKSTKFNEGIPEPRYNMAVEYEADIRFKKENAPDEKSLKKLVITCNISNILAHVKKMEPLCFAQATEVSMRKKAKENKRESVQIEDAVFEAAIELDEPPSMSTVPDEPEAEEEPELEPEPETDPALEAAPISEPVPVVTKDSIKETEQESSPKPKNKKGLFSRFKKKKEPTQEPVAKPASEEKPKAKKKKKKRTSTAKPTPAEAEEKAKAPEEEAVEHVKPKEESSSSEPQQPVPIEVESPPIEPPKPGIRVRSTEVFCALGLNFVKEDPSTEDYERLRKNTENYFLMRLRKAFGAPLDRIELVLHHKEFGNAKPDKNYNVYVEWDIEAVFMSKTTGKRDSLTADRGTRVLEGESDIPPPAKMIEVLVQHTNVIDYLIKAVQPIEDSGFAKVGMGLLSAKTATKTL